MRNLLEIEHDVSTLRIFSPYTHTKLKRVVIIVNSSSIVVCGGGQ